MELWQIKERLEREKDEKNALFFQKISPTAKNITGVRIPILRNLAKDIIKSGSEKDFIENYKVVSHE